MRSPGLFLLLCLITVSVQSRPTTLLPVAKKKRLKSSIPLQSVTNKIALPQQIPSSPPTSPKHPFSPVRSHVNLQGLDMETFSVWANRNTPISVLTDDCLYEIFRHCATASTLCAISRVCRRWRKVALNPSIVSFLGEM